ncbi:hypothetical protein diail_9493 [Diaporthe ilicicola]|nr:hypothetical protein diail_9493 [Diaporthe ilicicola]
MSSASRLSEIPRVQRIEGCFLQADGSSNNNIDHLLPKSQPQSLSGPSTLALQLPVTLRIFFDATKHLAFFRLYTTIELEINSQTCPTPFFLDISPDKIYTLSLRAGSAEALAAHPPPAARCLDFRLTAPGSVSLIAPQALGPGHLQPATHAAWEKLERLRFLAKQGTVSVSLPSTANILFLTTCCEAISAQQLFVTPLRPDPRQTNLITLYRGQGGRVVDVDNEVFLVPPPSGPPSLPDQPPPPAYDGARHASASPEQPPPTPTTPPEAAQGPRKRARIPSPPSPGSDSSSPNYRTWEHFKLAVGEREKMMAELLRRADKKEVAMNKLLAQVGDEARYLTELVAAAKERELALQNRGVIAAAAADNGSQRPPETQTHASPPSALSDAVSTASIASDVSDRVQAYIATQLDQLRDELRGRGYMTADDVEDLFSGRYVEEEAMLDAIREVVDEHMSQVRERVLDAWL